MLLTDLVGKFQKAERLADGSYLVLCPAHPDKHPSLHITQAEDKLLIKCQAGCRTEKIISSLGLTLPDLFTTIEKKITATYDYQDEAGNLLFQVVRYEPKSFAQRHKNNHGEWVWNMNQVRRVLYHLPEIIRADETIYLCEGEKDADQLWTWGQVATTSPGGANAWKDEYAEPLIGKRVVVIPDKDEVGYQYARQVIRALQNKARELRCIILPGDDVKDFCDWLAKGNDIATLPSLEQDIAVLFIPQKPDYNFEEDAIIWQNRETLIFKAEALRQERTGIHARISILSDFKLLAWSLINIEKSEDRIRLANLAHSNLKFESYTKEALRQDLDLFCAGLWDFNLQTFTPELMEGDETQEPPHFFLYPYIIEGGGAILFAPPGRGKSNTALIWAQSINCGVNKIWSVTKAPVLYINLERSSQSLKRRLASVNNILGLAPIEPLLTLNARGKSLANVAPAIKRAIKKHAVKLIILDSISRAGYGDLTENRPVNAIIDDLSSLCDSWLALGHTPRASEEHIYGSVLFEAGADIVVQLRSQVIENKLGIGYEITKSNDLPQIKQKVFAFEFSDWQLTAVRVAKPFEFPEIEVKAKSNMLAEIKDFILSQDSAEATATEIEEATGYNRANISKLLNHQSEFVKTRKSGKSQFFGVAQQL